jgi:cytochrome c-type biogenesis protein CcmH/NrfF
LSRGREPAAIKAELVTIYGNSILASPPFEGLGGVAWLGTVAIFLGGLAAAGWWLRGRRTAPATESAPVPTDRDGALRQRLRSELAHDD